jgi:hypothetical protein
MLKSRGLALNLAKTVIYNKKEALYNFQFSENIFLDTIIIPNTSRSSKLLANRLIKRFQRYKNYTDAKSWDKVTKRYITIFGKMKSDMFLNELVPLYIKYPSLRANLLTYLGSLGYGTKTKKKVLLILDKLDIFDDISLYQICNLVTEWAIPDNKLGNSFLKSFEEKIVSFSFKRSLPCDFYSLLWFKAKYSPPEKLLTFLTQYQNIWLTDTFLRRQATALFSRLYITDKKKVEKFLSLLSSSGDSSSVSLANQITAFSKISVIIPRINSYIFPTPLKSDPNKYSLSRFLVLCSLLNSDVVRSNKIFTKKCIDRIKDPYYKKWLKEQYGIK